MIRKTQVLLSEVFSVNTLTANLHISVPEFEAPL